MLVPQQDILLLRSVMPIYLYWFFCLLSGIDPVKWSAGKVGLMLFLCVAINLWWR